ncbi:carbon-nitrogen hydrolase family protein [Nodosilinea sp. P-1105]|uniref:carbon-nitrogen hydrolase family protein n=1 Tax=Nodosilinea sp. P-1105 TaxID=2546229 RepID=UPI00146CEB98|nr:carbon-nitrogen hydrolase family protein [Nodosilinea sp. P-1105]NMF82959.1 carbon-nitrogen hydrolase family protein [Nodosilinea sp. P-1105]
MKVCAAQLRPAAGNFATNVAKHLQLIELAVAQQADLVFFPELSLTGFEPRLASSLAIGTADPRLDMFQECSDRDNLLIGVGMPVTTVAGVHIGMFWFAPGVARRMYAKQQLHIDEHPYFVPGAEQLVLESGGHKLVPAICYESLQMDHADSAAALSAEIYLASVAKPAGGLAKAMVHYPAVARKHNIFVIMANCIGPSDGFVGVGQSAAWNACGELLAQLDAESEGVVLLDIASGRASVHELISI